jgi:hypothetical protein
MERGDDLDRVLASTPAATYLVRSEYGRKQQPARRDEHHSPEQHTQHASHRYPFMCSLRATL